LSCHSLARFEDADGGSECLDLLKGAVDGGRSTDRRFRIRRSRGVVTHLPNGLNLPCHRRHVYKIQWKKPNGRLGPNPSNFVKSRLSGSDACPQPLPARDKTTRRASIFQTEIFVFSKIREMVPNI
jgi:hypothetical protein